MPFCLRAVLVCWQVWEWTSWNKTGGKTQLQRYWLVLYFCNSSLQGVQGHYFCWRNSDSFPSSSPLIIRVWSIKSNRKIEKLTFSGKVLMRVWSFGLDTLMRNFPWQWRVFCLFLTCQMPAETILCPEDLFILDLVLQKSIMYFTSSPFGLNSWQIRLCLDRMKYLVFFFWVISGVKRIHNFL